MRIKSKITGKFICEINIEEYCNELRKMGIEVSIPLKIKVSEKGITQEYKIYPTHYELTKK